MKLVVLRWICRRFWLAEPQSKSLVDINKIFTSLQILDLNIAILKIDRRKVSHKVQDVAAKVASKMQADLSARATSECVCVCHSVFVSFCVYVCLLYGGSRQGYPVLPSNSELYVRMYEN